MTQIFGIHCIDGLPTHTGTDSLSDNSKSSVYIASDPTGAQIFIDNIRQTGFNTPAMLTNIPSGHHNFKLTHPECIDVESAISLDPGRTYNIFLTMGKMSKMSSSSNYLPIVLIVLGIGLGYLLIRNKMEENK